MAASGGGGAVAGVALHVLRQMIAPHESPRAHRADELLLAGVGPLVPGELVAAGELPAAVVVRTGKRALAGVRASVSFQMRRLEVVFSTAGVLALVDATASGRLAGLTDRARAVGDRRGRGDQQKRRPSRQNEGRAEQSGDHRYRRRLRRQRLQLRRTRRDRALAIGVLVVDDYLLLPKAHLELEALEDVLGLGGRLRGRRGAALIRRLPARRRARLRRRRCGERRLRRSRGEVRRTACAVAVGAHYHGGPRWLGTGRRRAVQQ